MLLEGNDHHGTHAYLRGTKGYIWDLRIIFTEEIYTEWGVKERKSWSVEL